MNDTLEASAYSPGVAGGEFVPSAQITFDTSAMNTGSNQIAAAL